MRYVDGYVLPRPEEERGSLSPHGAQGGQGLARAWRARVPRMRRRRREARQGHVVSRRACKLKDDETVVFSWIVYKSRAHRDSVNAKVMKDPRLAEMMDPKNMPFDGKRMFWGGFKVIVEV